MAFLPAFAAVASLLLGFPLTAHSANLPRGAVTIPSTSPAEESSPSPAVETRSMSHHISTPALIAVIVVPILVLAAISISICAFCRARGGGGLDFGRTKIREIVSPISPTGKGRSAFYELGRKEGYASITALHPTLDPDSPRSSTMIEPLRRHHARNDTLCSVDSTASLHMAMSAVRSGSPRLGSYDMRHSGRYTPVGGRESPAFGFSRSRTQNSVSSISLPMHGQDEDRRRCSSPLAWTAEQIISDGSDRTTPVPWEHRAETESKNRSRSSTPVLQMPRAMSPEQDISAMSPYYDPHINSRRMSIPMVLSIAATPATPTTPMSMHQQVMSETVPSDEYDVVPDMQRMGDERDKRMSRSQTLKSINSVTTIRTSVDTQFTDWQLPSVEEQEEVPKIPAGLQRKSAIRRPSSGML